MASVKRQPSGKWRARFRDDAGREHARHFETKRDAQRWLDEVTASQLTGQYVDPSAGKVTLERYFAEWSARQIWAPGTTKSMELSVSTCSFKGTELRRLRRSHVEGWVKKMDDDELAPGTIRTRLNNVRAVLKSAVRDRYLAIDPTERVALPRARRSEHAMEIPTAQQVGALLSGADSHFRALVALCAFAGLRLGEAAALRLSDVDFLRRQITVARQMRPGIEKGSLEVVAPKYGSERIVFAADELLQIINEHLADVGTFGGERYLFMGKAGLPPSRGMLAYQWKKARDAAGVDGVRLHDLRHFYASGLIANGCDVVTVQQALGHSKATTTLNTYSHLWPTAEDKTRAAVGVLVREALANSADSVRTAEAGVTTA
ncbi:tyrosine-type recombinase/integrase [Leucobacter musarum]|uniref:tyrosine-type recombinase/integrase n=1 Tax=Leucobacter musarum TaxID=1930747 RepID=UPI0006A79809|nr:site-specific integrase [Leucobacter musarum]